jgi:hypothetical protein
MIRYQIHGLTFYRFSSLEDSRIKHAVFTRLGGVSEEPYSSLNLSLSVPDRREEVMENRRRFYAAMDVDPEQAVRAAQVHGARVAVVRAADRDVQQTGTDGLITDEPGLALVMAFADCVPVMLYDPVRRAVGIVHAGWRGTVAGVCQAAVRQMTAALGCCPTDIRAAIGPSIGPCCYQVGPDLVEAVTEAFGRSDGLFVGASGGGLHFDQWMAVELALRQAGLRQIEQSGICTACRVDEFFSHRAEGGRTGRFGALIVLCE